MDQVDQHSGAVRRSLVRTVGAAAITVSALSVPVIAFGSASAATRHTTTFTVSSVKNAKLGTLLVSSRTLYTLRPSKVACNAACMKIWPPALLPKGVTKVTAGKGVSQAKLGTIKASGGRLQATYAGKALYWFSGDTGAGQVRGNITDAWGKWTDVVLAKPSGSGSAGSGSGGNTGSGGVAF
jgi:predicted lipoprotein with Yx(FWY)xxD motif